MKITWVRTVSQIFFICLFMWLCFVTTFNEPNLELTELFLELDPLIALSTLLATGVVFGGLVISLVTVILTLLFGRVFCGWICPLGTVNQFLGWIGQGKKQSENIKKSAPSKAQSWKYLILLFLLFYSVPGLIIRMQNGTGSSVGWFIISIGIILVASGATFLTMRRISTGRAVAVTALVAISLALLSMFLPDDATVTSATLIGLIDPMSIAYRTFDLLVLPMIHRGVGAPFNSTRLTADAGLLWAMIIVILAANFIRPRAFCRYICPSGALFGLLSRFTVFRIGQNLTDKSCSGCKSCEKSCDGACNPSGKISTPECTMCMNCIHECPDDIIRYNWRLSDAGVQKSVDIGRRGFLVSLTAGLTVLPVVRLAGKTGPNWDNKLIRPPGALREDDLLARCVKCGQCMKICPTNVLQPAGVNHGLEAMWTPSLNMRIGTSGCQLNCTACSQVCATGAIRPLTLDEKLGRGTFESAGPVRIGMAFVDRNRCLPWSFGTPCIVCQENCPVSPKAITLDIIHEKVTEGTFRVVSADGTILTPDRPMTIDASGGNYFVAAEGRNESFFRIKAVTATRLELDSTTDTGAALPVEGDTCRILVRLQRPLVNPSFCIGCGTCEHECPVSGTRAISVTAENESRDPERAMMSARNNNG